MADVPIDVRGWTEEEIEELEKALEELDDNPESAPGELRDFVDAVPRVQTHWEEDTASDRTPEKKEALAQHLANYLHGGRCFYLGRADSWTETKWDNGLKCRTCRYKAYACFSHPRLAEVWGDVVDCAKIALGVATLAAILASPKAATPVFRAAFATCLEAKGIEWARAISVRLKVEKDCGRCRWCL